MSRTIHRYEIPVDDAPHELTLAGPILKVEVKPDQIDVIEVWAEYRAGTREFKRTFQVYGTGHEIPEDGLYIGTTTRSLGLGLVWHVYELTAQRPKLRG